MNLLATLRQRKRRFYKSLLLGFGVTLLLSVVSYLGYLDPFEAKALDFLIALRGRQHSPEIVLVKIDDQAFEKLGERQPLPRSYLADLIEVAARAGARVIGVDIELKVPTNPAEDERLSRVIHDVEAAGRSRIVLTYVIRPEKEGEVSALYRRLPFYAAALNGVAGFANASVDSDGFVRKIPLAVRAGDGRTLPAFGLAVLAGEAGYDVKTLDASLHRRGEIQLRLAEWNRLDGQLLQERTPLHFRLDESWKINFAGGQGSFVALPSEPLAMLAKTGVPLATDNPLRGKIVLIGATFQDSRDFLPTPYGLMSGLEIHANVIHTLLTRSQIAPAQRVLAFFILLVFSFATSLLITLLSPIRVLIFSLAAIPFLLLPLSYAAFSYVGLWIDFVAPLLAIGCGALAAQYLEARHVRKSLGQHVGWEVARQIVEQNEELAGKTREVTVFFTDVRNFTTLCEGLPPDAVVARMSELFAMMGKVIARHDGLILDFIGDAVLAVFGTPADNPQHARAAVQTAVEMLAGLDAINAQWEKKGIAPLRIGVGIHTGEVVAGIVGTGERKKFDITGDTVNTGSRVEGLNKELGTEILVTQETAARLDGRFALRDCGSAPVKGRAKPVHVFAVLRAEKIGDGTEVAA